MLGSDEEVVEGERGFQEEGPARAVREVLGTQEGTDCGRGQRWSRRTDLGVTRMPEGSGVLDPARTSLLFVSQEPIVRVSS